MNYVQACKSGQEYLSGKGVEDAELCARRLLEHVCHTPSSALYTHPKRPLSRDEEESYLDLIRQRGAHRPLAYITGETGFMGLTFMVDESVLVPRPDTETLVEECMPQLHDGMTFMDLCTGSACIALSLLHYSNHTNCVATDISHAALEVAARNAQALSLSDRIRFVKADLFPARKELPVKGVDLIVSNPPYIASEVLKTLQEEVRCHEPQLALDGGADGLDFYKRLTDKAPVYLARGGSLLVEIGYDQGESVPALFSEAGFKDVRLIHDLAGNARVVAGVYY